MLPLTAIAIGVVTDLGRIEAAICGVAPISRATVVPVIIATQAADKADGNDRFPAGADLVQLFIQRKGKGHYRRLQQIVQNFAAGKITLVGDPGQQQEME